MDKNGKIETVAIISVAVICIGVSLIDFVGALEALPFIANRTGIMSLLAIGALALYIAYNQQKTLNNLQSELTRGNTEILRKLDKENDDHQFLKELHSFWSERDNLIQKLFDAALNFPRKNGKEAFLEFLKEKECELDNGRFFNVNLGYPWDLNIVAINFNGIREYHTKEELMNKPSHKDHPTWEILKRRNGSQYWINRAQGKLLHKTDVNYPSMLRFTKLYYREIVAFQLILVVESNINILPNLPKPS